MIAAIASFGACVLVYTGLSRAIRRLVAKLKPSQSKGSAGKTYAEQKCALQSGNVNR